MKVIPAFFALIVILVILFPLYAADYSQISLYLAAENSEVDEKESSILLRVERRTERIYKIAEKEIEALKDLKNYLMLILGSLLATAGLLTNNVTAIIGSMFLSSLMGVTIASAMSLAVYDARSPNPLDLFYRRIRGSLKGIGFVILSSFLIALLTRSFIPLQVTPELASRGVPNLADLIVAIGTGVAGALSVIYKGEIGALVGSAIAIALVPPSAAIGISAAMMNPSLFSGAIFLLTINVLALLMSGYLSAKIYVLNPIIEHVLRSETNALSGLLSLIKSWMRAAIGLSGSLPLKDALMGIWKRIVSVASLPFLALLIAVLVTTDFADLISLAHSRIIDLIEQTSSLLMIPALLNLLPKWISIWIPILVCLISVLLSSKSLWSSSESFRNEKKLSYLIKIAISSFLLWLSLGYLFGISVLSSIASILTISLLVILAVLLYKPLWESKGKVAVKLFIVLTFTVVLINSASIFGIVSARETLYSGGFIDFCKEIVASYIGVSPENIDVSFEGVNTLRVNAYVDLMKLESLKEMKGIEKFIEDSLREFSGREVRVSLEFRLVPS